jgi:hypothetical protein
MGNVNLVKKQFIIIKYISENRLSIEEFKTPFETSLLSNNRWVELSKIVPWDCFASSYINVMKAAAGRPGISPRMVLGALIVKHLENLDDRGVIACIQENVYMQFFVGHSLKWEWILSWCCGCGGAARAKVLMLFSSSEVTL